MENTHVVKEISLTIEKRALVLLLPYLGSISLQARTKLKKSLTFLIVTLDPIEVNVGDTWMQKLVNMVYHHLSKSKLSLRTAP